MGKTNRHKATVQLYIKCIQTINKLVKSGDLEIDWVESRVGISLAVHMMFQHDDKKYLAFFDKIRAWINFERGRNRIKKVLEPQERIDFNVFSIREVYKQGEKEISLADTFDLDDSEYVTQKEHKIILVGYAQGDELDYIPFQGGPSEEEGNSEEEP